MKLLPIVLLLSLLTTPLAAFQETDSEAWPAWRGPTMDGQAGDSANPPTQWNEGEKIKWKIKLPGLGNSTPSVWDGKVILTFTRPTGQKIDRPAADNGNAQPNEIHDLVVAAYDLESGKSLWETTLAQKVPNETGHQTGSYASASTVTDGKRIYAFYGSLGLYAVDMTGKKLWERELPAMTTAAGFGEGASPALAENVLVIPWDEEGQSFVAGINTKTGKDLWRTDRATDSAWTTPLIVKDGDQSVVVTTGTKTTRAYDLQSGNEIWHCNGMSANPTSSPVADGNVVFIGNSYKGNVVQAIRFAGATGDLTQTSNLLWTHRKSASYVPTPVVVDGKLYFLKGSQGILNCLDAKDGETVFPARRVGLKNVHASPMVAAGRIYISSREGDTVVLDLSNDCNILATNHLDDVFDASPVAIGKKLLLRGRSNLYCIQ